MVQKKERDTHTLCPRRSNPFYIVCYYLKWVTTSWTDSTKRMRAGESVLERIKRKIEIDRD